MLMVLLRPLVLVLLLGATGPADTSTHDFHVSYGRLAIEGTNAVIRVRFFQNDLVEAIQKQNAPDFELTAASRADSIALSYIGRRLRVAAADHPLEAVVRASGEDLSGQEPMWWYLLEFAAPSPIRDIEITNTLLFETFDDQKNIVQMQHFPSEKTWSFYFTPDSDHFSVVMP